MVTALEVRVFSACALVAWLYFFSAPAVIFLARVLLGLGFFGLYAFVVISTEKDDFVPTPPALPVLFAPEMPVKEDRLPALNPGRYDPENDWKFLGTVPPRRAPPAPRRPEMRVATRAITAQEDAIFAPAVEDEASEKAYEILKAKVNSGIRDIMQPAMTFEYRPPPPPWMVHHGLQHLWYPSGPPTTSILSEMAAPAVAQSAQIPPATISLPPPPPSTAPQAVKRLPEKRAAAAPTAPSKTASPPSTAQSTAPPAATAPPKTVFPPAQKGPMTSAQLVAYNRLRAFNDNLAVTGDDRVKVARES